MDTSLPTCYRHPDRETRLGCSACGRPVCTDCVRQAAVGQKCLECAQPDPRARVITAHELRGRFAGSTPVTMTLLVVSVGVFLVRMLLGGLGTDPLFLWLAQINAFVSEGQWYRLVTAAFLHAGLMHLLFNMWALYLFGPDLERGVGRWPFLALYVSAAVTGGAAFFLLSERGIAVGASGAIFGLFGAWLVASYRSRHTLAGQAGLRQLLVLLALNLALPLIVPRIAWEAHLGGLLAGMAIAFLWGLRPVAQSPLRRTGAAAVVGVLAFAVVLLA